MLSERQQNHHFKRLASQRLNSTCADCYVKGATWTSLDFGVFICINCSGCHRSFGMHITRVRSTKLDAWSREDAKMLELVGNEVANSYYLSNKNGQFLKANPMSFGNSDSRRAHIKKKYIEKAYARRDLPSPVDFVKQSNFNLKKQDMRDKYLGSDGQGAQKTVSAKRVTANKQKPISFKGLKKSNKKDQTRAPGGNSDLLDFDLEIPPAKNAPANLWDFSSKKVDVQKPKQTSTAPDMLDFDFVEQPKTTVKDTDDFLDLGVGAPKANFPRPPSKSPQMFKTNPNLNYQQHDKYNCLSFNQQPMVNQMFYSNPTQPANNNWNNGNNQMNGVSQGSQRGQKGDLWSLGVNMNKPSTSVPDKYDIFDMCFTNNRNGYFN